MHLRCIAKVPSHCADACRFAVRASAADRIYSLRVRALAAIPPRLPEILGEVFSRSDRESILPRRSERLLLDDVLTEMPATTAQTTWSIFLLMVMSGAKQTREP